MEKVIDTSDARFYIITRAYAPVLLKNLLEGIELLTKSPNEHHLYANDQYWKRLYVHDFFFANEMNRIYPKWLFCIEYNRQADGWYRFKTRLEVQRLAEAGSDAGIMNVQAMIGKSRFVFFLAAVCLISVLTCLEKHVDWNGSDCQPRVLMYCRQIRRQAPDNQVCHPHPQSQTRWKLRGAF